METIIEKAQPTKVGGCVNQSKPEQIKPRYHKRVQNENEESISSSGEEDANNHDAINDIQKKLNDSKR